LYGHYQAFGGKEVFVRIFGTLLLTLAALAVINYVQPDLQLPWRWLVSALLLFGTCQYLWHMRYLGLLKNSMVSQRTIVLGTGELAQRIHDAMMRVPHNHVLQGFVQANSNAEGSDLPILGVVPELSDIVRQYKVQKIVIALAERRGVLPVRDILSCKLNGIEVVDGLNFYEKLTGKLMVEGINPSWIIFSDGFCVTSFMRIHKRVFDIFWASVGLIVSLPFFPVVALFIKLDSPGPVFFMQTRVGKNERLFKVIKFRTMRQDAEKETGAVWAQQNDPRVTALGRFLRKVRIDELPQLFNVLWGDMSFVGPRPERPEFVRDLNQKIPYYAKRHSAKPGITGWAQVKYPYGSSEEDALEKLRYDLFYIKNYSTLLDFSIITETVKVVLFGRGGR